MKLRQAREGVAAIRSGVLKKKGIEERTRTGRLWAHLKHIEMKNHVRDIRTQEGTIVEEEKSYDEKLVDVLKDQKSETGQSIKIEEEFNLPYGFGFDDIIKEKVDLINNKKFQNNRLMDELVERLGYLDYRDALAANKYILEAKRHGDYHQKARARTLSLALGRMTRLKREQFEKRVSKKLANESQELRQDAAHREQTKLEMLMDEDGLMAGAYQELYKDVKGNAE